MSYLNRHGLATSTRAVISLFILMFLGAAGNYFSIPLFYGVDFLLGSIAVMVIVYLFGITWGTVAALIASIYTYYLWQNPHLIIIFTSEAIFMGVALRCKHNNMLLINGLFWLLIGTPLIWLFRHGAMNLDTAPTLVINLKLIVNGLFNTFMATLIIFYSPLCRWVDRCKVQETKHFSMMLFNILTAFVLIPSVLMMVYNTRNELGRVEKNIESMIKNKSSQVINHLILWEEQHFHAISELAQFSADSDRNSLAELQNSTDSVRRAFSDFTRVHIDDEAGTSITFSPPFDENGQPTIGLNFADRPYYTQLKTTLQPVASDVFMGRVGNPVPILIIGVPITSQGDYLGSVIASLDLGYIDKLLNLAVYNETATATILDSNGLVIASTRTDLFPMKSFVRAKGDESNLPPTERWQHSFYVSELPISENLQWKLIIEVPVAPYQNLLQQSYIKNLAIMIFMLVLALGLSSILSHRISIPLANLAGVTSNLPEKIFQQQPVEWPKSSLTEVHSLVSNSKLMAETLRQSFSEMQLAKDKAVEEKNKLEAIIAGIGDGISILNLEFQIVYQNQILKNIMGEAIGEYCYKAFDNKNDICQDCPVAATFQDGGIHTRERCPVKFEGRKHFEITSAPLKDTAGNISGAIEVFHDVTEKRRMIQKLLHQAYHDPLTDMPNRELFNERLSMALAHAQWHNEMLAVMFLDLDRFKVVNDMLGHSVGDQLLQEVAKRLTAGLRQFDTGARLGGDEFTVLLPKITDEKEALKIAQKMVKIFQRPLIFHGQEFYITASIGIALYPEDGDNAEILIKHADAAMYRAKENGRNTYQLYSPSLNDKIMEKMAMENSLRHALERNELVVHYQPLVDIQNGQITGMEALVRWNHPELGLVPPAKFIPLAEETGLIIPIGEWVLRTACTQNKALEEAGYPPIRVTVNLSAYQFQQQKLVQTISKILRQTGLDPCRLELEITESLTMHDADFSIKVLQKLRAKGIQIAIDDFGTGYSSLNYLKSLPVNTLKIDRSFVRDITTDLGDAAIVATIISLARNMGLKVIAEGVETQEQLEFLKERHCDEMQGYLVSKPVPPEDFQKLYDREWLLPKNDEPGL